MTARVTAAGGKLERTAPPTAGTEYGLRSRPRKRAGPHQDSPAAARRGYEDGLHLEHVSDRFDSV